MAVATTPLINGVIRPVTKRRIEKPEVIVVMEDNCPSTCSYHKQCLCILIDIYQKNKTMTNDVYESKIAKIVDMVSCESESSTIFQTFCGISFLDRCQDKETLAGALRDVDERISNISWKMKWKLQNKCYHLLTRMGMIENLNSSDTELICLLCQLCKTTNHDSVLLDLLLEIGRSIWPYLKRPLWHNEPFVDFVADIFETIGDRLEKLHPKNFCIAWQVILKNLISSNGDMSSYSRLRLLTIIELKHRRWSLSSKLLAFYREQYEEFTAARKKEILFFIGFLSSRRKTSLSAKPGRSAADFLKRRESSECQKARECSSTSSAESSEAFGEVCEDVFEQDESVLPPNNSTDRLRNESLSNAEAKPSQQETSANGYPKENNRRKNLLKTNSVEGRKETVHMTERTGQNSRLNEQNVRASGRMKVEGQDEIMNGEKQLKDEQKELNRREVIAENRPEENGNMVLEDAEDNGNVWEESRSTWQETKTKMKNKENVWEESGNSWPDNGVGTAGKETKENVWEEDIWQESDNAWQDNDTKCEDTSCTDARASSPRNDDIFLSNRKREIVKVPSKYVGRVIGSQGTVISSIQDESGARVRIVRPPKDKVFSRPAVSLSTVKNIVHNTLGLPKNKTPITDDSLTEDVKDEQEKEIEFEIIGSLDCIEKAKLKIDSIINQAKSYAIHANLKRSFSDGDEANFKNFRRSSFHERRTVILKVASKYVGRVIGSGGSMIMSIEQESGAKVTFVKDNKREKYRGTEHMVNMEQKNEDETHDERARHQEEKQIAKESKDVEVEAQLETLEEENTEKSKENDQVKSESEERFQENLESGMWNEKKQNGEDQNGCQSDKVDACEESSVEAAKVEETTVEHEFKITGTDEAIEKAKTKIQYIMELVDNAGIEKRPFTRSASCSSSRRGFRSLQRSLSCPISNWGESCAGDCASCQKGSYCRSFLLEKSQSLSCWVRPDVLSLTQEADWAEFIVKTQVDDQTLWRPRTSSSASINSGSSEEVAASEVGVSEVCF